MSKYFTHNELVRRRIPHPSGFGLVLEKIEEIAMGWDKVLHAGVIGSTVRDRDSKDQIGGNARSDIDCFLVTVGATESDIEKMTSFAFDRANTYFVPLEIHAYSVASAMGSLHSIGPGFARHVRTHVRTTGNIKGDFAGCFVAHTINVAQESHAYVTRKISALNKRGMNMRHMTPAEQAHFFGKLIDAPFHAIRRVLDAREIHGENDSKKATADLFTRCIDDQEVARGLSSFYQLDQEYTAFVEWVRDFEQTLSGNKEFERSFLLFHQRFAALHLSVPDFLRRCVRYIDAPTVLVIE